MRNESNEMSLEAPTRIQSTATGAPVPTELSATWATLYVDMAYRLILPLLTKHRMHAVVMYNEQ